MTAIYGLCDPDTMDLRYIGKAYNVEKRLLTHMRDALRYARPVCNWIKSLMEQGKTPAIVILDETSDWRAKERELISRGRLHGHKLLNLADGGDHIPVTAEQRKANASWLNSGIRKEKKITREQLVVSTYGWLLKYYNDRPCLLHGFQAAALKEKMRALYAENPKAYKRWANI